MEHFLARLPILVVSSSITSRHRVLESAAWVSGQAGAIPQEVDRAPWQDCAKERWAGERLPILTRHAPHQSWS